MYLPAPNFAPEIICRLICFTRSEERWSLSEMSFCHFIHRTVSESILKRWKWRRVHTIGDQIQFPTLSGSSWLFSCGVGMVGPRIEINPERGNSEPFTGRLGAWTVFKVEIDCCHSIRAFSGARTTGKRWRPLRHQVGSNSTFYPC